MKTKKVLLITTFSLMLAYYACAAPYFILGRLYDADGSTGNSYSANSYASVALFRDGISGQIGRQNNGPDPSFPNKIYPALYSGVASTAYCLTDVGSSQWLSIENAGQVIRSVYEVQAGMNGWNESTYLACTTTVINPSDWTNSSTNLHDARLMLLAPPAATSYQDRISITFTGINMDDVASYNLYRKELPSGNPVSVAVIPQNRDSVMDFTDRNVVAGRTYSYNLSVNFAWETGNGDPQIYETTVRSRDSGASLLRLPTFTITPTAIMTVTATITETATEEMTLTTTQTAVPTATITQTLASENADAEKLKENLIREKLVVFTNPMKDNKIKLGFYSERNGKALIYLYNLSAESAEKFTVDVKEGVNVVEQVLKDLSSGLYAVRVTIKYSDSEITLPVRKVAVIK
jgi:hypothetical protein